MLYDLLADGLNLLASTPEDGELERKLAALATSEAASDCERRSSLFIRDALQQLRLVMLERRKRETELHALLQTSQNLLAADATDTLLNVITNRTRELLAADVAHLNMAHHSRRYTYMRATAGAMTEAFRSQRTTFGYGLTGLVVEQRSAYVTADYLQDPLITREMSGSQSVAAEGLITMAAVPIIHRDDVVGVLCASYRGKRSVSTEGLGLLASLASLAAVALSSAQLHDEKTTAVNDLTSANQVISQQNKMLEWSATAHDRLAQLVLAGASVGDVAASVGDLLKADVLVLGADGDTVGRSSGRVDRTKPEFAFNVPAPTFTRCCRQSMSGDRIVWTNFAIAGTEILGSLNLFTLRELNTVEHQTLERATVVTALLLLMQRSVHEAESRTSAEILEDVIYGGDRARMAVPRALNHGLDLRSPCVLLAVVNSQPKRPVVRNMIRRFAATSGGLSGDVGGYQVCLIPMSSRSPESLASELADVLSTAANADIAVSAAGPAHGVCAVRDAYLEAVGCLRAMACLGLTRQGRTMATLGFIGLLLANDQEKTIDEYIERTLGPLLRYDNKREAELIRTLSAYIATGRSLKRVGERLHIHPNTVLQRLQRIADVLGQEWQAPDNLNELHLALRLQKVAGYSCRSATDQVTGQAV